MGYDIDKFKEFYKDVRDNELEEFEIEFLREDPTQLIVWGENQQIFGWIIWHASNVKDHGDGTTRDEEDTEILTKIIGENEEFIELHELWLRKEYRGKGYGKQIFDFFENFVSEKGYKHVVYYAFDPAAIHICRKRGYKEEFYKKQQWYTLSKTL